MRGLSEIFINDLKEGKLNELLNIIKRDDTLDLEIRKNYINIYYRGGNICKVDLKKDKYKFSFATEYASEENKMFFKNLFNEGNISKIVENIPLLKHEMDLWFSKHPKSEREFQQLILRENNLGSISNDTDYYIADIEYANEINGSRFDMVAVKWLSTSKDRKKTNNLKLVFIEVKYGDNALTGNSGIKKHIDDIYKYLKTNDLFQEAENIINQKIELNLIKGIKDNKVIKVSKEKPEFILLCANHKPAKSKLKEELIAVIKSAEYTELKKICDIKMAQSSFMGYGLYDNCMKDFEEFIKEL